MNSLNFKIIPVILFGLPVAVRAQQLIASIQMIEAERQHATVEAAMASSVAHQLASVQQHAQRSFFLTPASLSPTLVELPEQCQALSVPEVNSLAGRAASANQVSADLVRAVMHQESGFRPCAISSKGASGLMQLMPDTAADLGVSDVFDPEQNAFGGAQLLRQLLDRYSGNLNLALGAYNAGPASVDQWGGIPPIPETRNYVNSIMQQITPVLTPGDIEPW